MDDGRLGASDHGVDVRHEPLAPLFVHGVAALQPMPQRRVRGVHHFAGFGVGARLVPEQVPCAVVGRNGEFTVIHATFVVAAIGSSVKAVLAEGTIAPDFTVPDHDGNPRHLVRPARPLGTAVVVSEGRYPRLNDSRQGPA